MNGQQGTAENKRLKQKPIESRSENKLEEHLIKWVKVLVNYRWL